MARVGGTSSRLGSEPRTEWSEGASGAGLIRMTPEWCQPLCPRQGIRQNRRVLVRFSRWFKIWQMKLGSVMNETTRILSPQFLQINGSV